MGKSVIICWLILWSCLAASAQQKIITGVVRDTHTEEPIPFAGIQFIGTTTGASTDATGAFRFVLDHFPADSLLVSVLGYQRLTLAVNKTLDSQHIVFELNRTGYAMKELVVHGGVNPAIALLKKIIQHKPLNNNDRLASYRNEIYNKLEVDINKVDKNRFLHSRLFKPFRFVFDNIDTTKEGDLYLPVLLTETLSDYYYQQSPHKTKEIIKASKTSGIQNQSITRYLGAMYQNVNVYDNFIPVFDKKFVSPIANFALLYYDYQIVDTQYIDYRKCFHVTFTPKRKSENIFTGDFWVNDTTYAIQKMNLEVTKDANINFISRISLVQEYQPLNDTLWVLSKDKFVADFTTPVVNKLNFIGRKTTTYRKVIVNDTAATNIFANKDLKDNVVIVPHARDRDSTYWREHRQEPLSKNESGVYTMIDSLHHTPAYKKYSNIVQFLVTGVKEVGPLELGPYYYELSANHLENIRLRLDLGSNTQFSKDLYLNGYLAYGTRDKTFKGKIAGLWLLHRHPRMYLYGSYTHDLDNGDIYYDQINTDNLFTLAVYKPGATQKFVMVDEKRLEFYREGHTGFSQHITLANKKFSPYAPLPTINYFEANGKNLQPLNNMELGVELRFAYDEKFLEGNYYRFSMGSDYPIVEFKYAAGLKNVLKSNYNYQKADLSISDYLSVAPLGNLYYNVFGGKIFGTLPFTLLQVPPGNNLYYYDKYAFDMMLRYEFLCDEYAGFNIEHEIGGGIFNYIPLMKKLKLRQFWTAKGLVGNLSEANRALNFQGDTTFKSLKGNPYLELGTGVENIFHFFRVDFVWRVTPKLQPEEPYHHNFGVFGSVRLQF